VLKLSLVRQPAGAEKRDQKKPPCLPKRIASAVLRTPGDRGYHPTGTDHNLVSRIPCLPLSGTFPASREGSLKEAGIDAEYEVIVETLKS